MSDISPEAREAALAEVDEATAPTHRKQMGRHVQALLDTELAKLHARCLGLSSSWTDLKNANDHTEMANEELTRALAAQTEELAQVKSQYALDLASIREQHQREANEWKTEDELAEELARLREEVANAKSAFGEHPDSEVDLAQRISELRDQVRGEFHASTENIRLRAENERLTRERDNWMNVSKEYHSDVATALARIAALEQQVSDERNLGDCLASALLGDFPARGALERYRDAVHEDSREEVQERIDAYFNTAATNEGGSEG